MVYRRAPKPMYRRKRTFGVVKRKTTMRRRFPRRNNNYHLFKKQVDITPISVTANASTQFAYSFKLSDVADSAAIAANYDQYRIGAVKVTFYPVFTEYTATTGNAALNAPQINTAIDLDSDIAPPSVAAVQEYKTCRTRMFTRPHSRYFKPRALGLVGIANGSTSTLGVYNLGRQWFCTEPVSNLNIEHYGIVGSISNPVNNPAMTVRVHVTYYIAFRNTK